MPKHMHLSVTAPLEDSRTAQLPQTIDIGGGEVRSSGNKCLVSSTVSRHITSIVAFLPLCHALETWPVVTICILCSDNI